MQTFLPYPDFEKSARVLDRARLGKQRIETYQLLLALDVAHVPKYGWRNHSATRMWRGYERALAQYGAIMCIEWIRRGYKDTTLPKILEVAKHFPEARRPIWLGNKRLHASHRSNLLRKMPDFYSRYGWEEPADLPYLWPKERAA